jgi:hypothetical protein
MSRDRRAVLLLSISGASLRLTGGSPAPSRKRLCDDQWDAQLTSGQLEQRETRGAGRYTVHLA